MDHCSLCAIISALLIAIADTVTCLKGYKGEAMTYDLNVDAFFNETRQGLTSEARDRIPDRVRAMLGLERFGDVTLRLVRQRFMGVPSRTMTSSRGTSMRTSVFENKDVLFYTDADGKGSLACDLRRDKSSGRLFCETSALISVGNFSCYIGPGAKKADCTPKVYETRNCYRKLPALPIRTKRTIGNPSVPQRGSRAVHREETASLYPLPAPGFKTVEVVFVVDAKFMQLFYERHPGSPGSAQREASVYMTLLANEINTFYDSFTKTSDEQFAIYVHPVAVLFPQYGNDFRWSSDNNDGKILMADSRMNKMLWKFVERIQTTRQADHVMAFTGYKLHREDGHVLGYAYSSTVCRQVTWKFSMVEFRHVDPSATAAHELGHALGAGHDEQKGCDPSFNVMTGRAYPPTADTRNAYYRFSRCSQRDIKNHLSKYPACTVDNGFTAKQFQDVFCSGFLGAQARSVDLQCQRKTGWVGSTACNAVVDDSGCYLFGSVRCRGREGRCVTRLGFVWNGTPCGADKMCFKGRCTRKFSICPVSGPA